MAKKDTSSTKALQKKVVLLATVNRRSFPCTVKTCENEQRASNKMDSLEKRCNKCVIAEKRKQRIQSVPRDKKGNRLVHCPGGCVKMLLEQSLQKRDYSSKCTDCEALKAVQTRNCAAAIGRNDSNVSEVD